MSFYVHESSYIDENVTIGEGTKIWHFSHVHRGAQIGKNCSLGQNVNIANNVKVGNGVKIQNNVSVYEGVELEDYVFCGPSMVFTNDLTPRSKYPKGSEGYKKTLVKYGASIGANATIVCGNTIGKWAMIASGAVVTKDVPDFALMAGVPAKQIGWVCECGLPLKEKLECPACNRKYFTSDDRLEQQKNNFRLGEINMEFRDLKTQYQKYKNEIDSAIQGVLNSANYIGGKQVNELEQQLAEYVGVKHCISCANGTDALSLVLMAWDVKEGDAVFVPDFTFFSTGEVVAFNGATPVFVDVDNKTFNLDPVKLQNSIEKTLKEGKLTPKVVIPVDLFGLPSDYTEIEKIAKQYNLQVMEDGAQGFGGNINGKMACSFGDAATTSFFPAKPLGCYGDGGAIFTNDDQLAETLKSIKVHGKGTNKYDNVRIGVNSRLDTIQAAVLQVKLKAFIEHEVEDVNKSYHLYTEKLKDIVETPYIPEGFYSSFAQYTIKLQTKEQRDGLQAELKKSGIPSMIYYNKPMHKQEAFSDLEIDNNDYPITNKLCETVLSLPMHPYLKEEEISAVVQVIREYLN